MNNLFDKKDILTIATADKAEIGTKGYFGDSVLDLVKKIDRNDERELISVNIDETYCFENSSGLDYLFFLPADKVKKSYRALESLEELFDFIYQDDDVYNQTEKAQILVGKKIVLKDKINKRIRVMVIQSVEFSSDSNDNSNVYLNCFSLNELFNTYVIQIKNEWVPFGIER